LNIDSPSAALEEGSATLVEDPAGITDVESGGAAPSTRVSGHLKQLGKHTLVYTAGIIIGKIASFVMLPVYTRFLTPSDYGVLELLSMTIDVIGMIASVGIVTGVFKFYSEETEQKQKNLIISTAGMSAVGLAAITSIAGILTAPLLTRLVFGVHGNPLYMRMYFLIYFLQTFEYVPFLLIRVQNRSVLFVLLNAGKLVLLLSLNILLVVHLNLRIEGVLLGNILATTTTALVLSAYMIREVGLHFSREKFTRMLHFGRAIVPWSLASFVLVFSDRLFLNYYSNTTKVGLYSLAYKFAFLLSVMAYTPFETVWTAQRFEVVKQPNAEEIFSSVFLYVNVVLGTIALVICLFIRDFLAVMSSRAFLSAYLLVPVLVSAQVIFVWSAYWTTGIYVKGHTRVMATGAFILVPLTLLLNFLMIPKFGAFGAAFATTAAYAARFAWIYYHSQRFYPIHQNWKEIAKLYAVLAVAVAIKYATQPEEIAASLAWSIPILITAVYLVFAKVLSGSDRAGLRHVVGQIAVRTRLRKAA
jgi:O-antigen/teichoic acid export membrane protein